jgi:hypothetical protein
MVVQRRITPPYVPPVKNPGDTSNFDAYPEDFEPYGREGPDPYREKVGHALHLNESDR